MSTKLVHLIIEEKRKEMIQLAEDYGYTSNLTVQASQELDYLLNTFSPSDQPYLVSSN
ncbi:aspartyl-phosphate phosphatase Spo0E family protein [Peribacillus psychrosaccharolyticus]|uniref:Aspartyl-phosphate phosphatase Spo0E family protein n=1 Tax=Peribacillus psychrosaccharolyticus TaxID=1407 RepID=A0A974NPS2_PERPY|nr:aspartyl-phosphate phosphatase Spo0E family protein [Peribacillus psychrosaccharolyticus]MEC2057491.1 aspartyl-phosphate phosphatase Spo0E family protein [Peribacillus psychrosaccharolyticus]MED3745946.1 aspartyl-phosphate phosphatase Spo0E family protein [Peribacillus psychrosaccharolyticus]QQT01789.1 aspartyl-phosphate phosphatase Spo0E family protein [Peribacillus psychrosaccharolyticus]